MTFHPLSTDMLIPEIIIFCVCATFASSAWSKGNTVLAVVLAVVAALIPLMIVSTALTEWLERRAERRKRK